MIPRPCLTCGRASRGTRCPEHTREFQRQRDIARGTPTQRGYDAAWRALRPAILARDGYVCQLCGLPGADSVDHIIPMAQGGDRLDPSNLRAAHRSCNSAAGGATRRTGGWGSF